MTDHERHAFSRLRAMTDAELEELSDTELMDAILVIAGIALRSRQERSQTEPERRTP